MDSLEELNLYRLRGDCSKTCTNTCAHTTFPSNAGSKEEIQKYKTETKKDSSESERK